MDSKKVIAGFFFCNEELNNDFKIFIENDKQFEVITGFPIVRTPELSFFERALLTLNVAYRTVRVDYEIILNTDMKDGLYRTIYCQ